MNKKVIWIAGALAVTGLTVYDAFHNCEGKCFICRHGNIVKAIAIVGGVCLGFYFNSCLVS